MNDFERDVIDRLARIEENNKSALRLNDTVLAQGLRLDTLEKRLDKTRDRLWGVIVLSLFVGVPLVTYLRVQLFGAFGIPHP